MLFTDLEDGQDAAITLQPVLDKGKLIFITASVAGVRLAILWFINKHGQLRLFQFWMTFLSGVIKKIEVKPGTGLQCLGAQGLWRQKVEEGGFLELRNVKPALYDGKLLTL